VRSAPAAGPDAQDGLEAGGRAKTTIQGMLPKCDGRHRVRMRAVLERVIAPPARSPPARCGWVRSILIGAEDFAQVAGPQAPPRLQADRVLQEPHRSTAHADVDPAGVVAICRDRGEKPAVGSVR